MRIRRYRFENSPPNSEFAALDLGRWNGFAQVGITVDTDGSMTRLFLHSCVEAGIPAYLDTDGELWLMHDKQGGQWTAYAPTIVDGVCDYHGNSIGTYVLAGLAIVEA